MKKFKFTPGEVVASVQAEQYTSKNYHAVTFFGAGLGGWGISKKITKKEYNQFGPEQARDFAYKANSMLAV